MDPDSICSAARPDTSRPPCASGCNSGVECLLPKQNVVGSNPITRSIHYVDAMLKFRLFVLLFVTSIVLFLVGLFAAIVPLVLAGAIMLTALFVTRRSFIPVRGEEDSPDDRLP